VLDAVIETTKALTPAPAPAKKTAEGAEIQIEAKAGPSACTETHCLLIYYTCDVKICVKNRSYLTYTMHSVLTKETGVTESNACERVC
jgi:hypothetical protein